MQVDVEEEEGALRDFIAHALKGRMVSAERINILVAALLEEDLTLDLLRESLNIFVFFFGAKCAREEQYIRKRGIWWRKVMVQITATALKDTS